MNDRELIDRLHLLAERRLMLRPGAARRFRAYLESDAGAAVWRRRMLWLPDFMGVVAGINRVPGPSENDRDLLAFIDEWAESHTDLGDVEPLPGPERRAAASTFGAGATALRQPLESGQSAPSSKVSGLRMKRRALVLKYMTAWPTIEADLSDGSRNGLTLAAYDKSARGWHELQAVEWAESKGKMIPDQSPLPRMLHRIQK